MSDEPSAPTPPATSFSMDEVRELLHLLEQSDVSEISIERGEHRLHLKRGTAAMPALPAALTTMTPMAAPVSIQMPAASAPPVAPPTGDDTVVSHTAGAHHAHGQELTAHELSHALKAPMVGTFYASSSPKDPPFIKEGDEIYAGDVVCIIEAMKIMNEIESDVDGRVARILVKDGQPIEYGQPLLIIEPL